MSAADDGHTTPECLMLRDAVLDTLGPDASADEPPPTHDWAKVCAYLRQRGHHFAECKSWN